MKSEVSAATTAPASVHVALVAVQLLFASLSVAGKVALTGLSPFGVVAFRAPLAFIILFGLFLYRRREQVSSSDLLFIAVCAFFGITLNQLLFIAGLSRTTATSAVVIGASIPVFTVAVAVLLRREAATPAKLVGLALALLGALVVVGGDHFDPQGGGHLTGNVLILCNSFCFSVYLVISRPLFARYGLITVMTWTFLFGAIGVLPFGAGALWAAAPHLAPRIWIALGYIVLGPTIGTYVLNGFALGRAPSSLVAIYVYLQPVVGALMAAAYLGERPGPGTLLGAVGIGVGIWLVNRADREA